VAPLKVTAIAPVGNSEMGPLPSSLDAERAVIGAILVDERALPTVIEAGLLPDHFVCAIHRSVFVQMVILRERLQPIDLVILIDSLKIEGEDAAYVASLADGMPKVSNVGHYTRTVRGKAVLRQLIHATHNIQHRAFGGEEQPEVLALSAIEHFSTIADAACSTKSWREKFHAPAELSESEADFLIEGILPPGVTFIGALSGTGKTWFALSMARAISTGKKFLRHFSVTEPMNCLYLCPEVSAKSFKKRLRCFDITERFFCQTIQDGLPLDLGDRVLLTAICELKPVIFLDTAIRFAGMEDENSWVCSAL
jgi:replicative DNA helicase